MKEGCCGLHYSGSVGTIGEPLVNTNENLGSRKDGELLNYLNGSSFSRRPVLHFCRLRCVDAGHARNELPSAAHRAGWCSGNYLALCSGGVRIIPD
jgi:hypothetical protein